MLPDDNGEPIDLDGREEEHGIQRDADSEWRNKPLHVCEDGRQSADRNLALVGRGSFWNTDSVRNVQLHGHVDLDQHRLHWNQSLQLGHKSLADFQ